MSFFCCPTAWLRVSFLLLKSVALPTYVPLFCRLTSNLFTAPAWYFQQLLTIIDCNYDHLLESLAIHAIAPLFNETLEDLIAFSFSFSSFSLSDDSETEKIIYIMRFVASTRYFDIWELIQKSRAILNLCLNVYKLTRSKEFWKFARMSFKSFDLLV